MFGTSILARCVLVVLVWALGSSYVWATPAELVILLDSSRSMEEKLPGSSQRKIDVAKVLASQVAQAAERAGHRVGLYRFRQQESIVITGMGKRTLVTEDPEQCKLVGDLLVGVGAGTAQAIQRWTDGKHGPGEPEVQALGHSPLLDAVRLIVRYIRARRMFNPQQNCVNSWIIVLTDGVDTCSSGGARLQALQELRKVSVKEDVRTLVLSMQAPSALTQTIAQMGLNDAGQAKVFGPKDGKALVQAVTKIEGRLAPEACLLSGVAPKQIGLTPKVPTSLPSTPQGCAGCGCSGSASLSFLCLGFFLVLGFLSLRQRFVAKHPARFLQGFQNAPLLRGEKGLHQSSWKRWLLWFAMFVLCSGCSPRGCSRAPQTPRTDAVKPGPKLRDPVKRAAQVVKTQEALLRASETLRNKELQPLIRPKDVFAQLRPGKSEGAIAKSCQRLVHSMGFVPYQGVQRGVVGCLATRRCNAWDRALVLQACLRHFGVVGELKMCRRHELKPQDKAALLKRAGSLGKEPPTQAFVAKLNKVLFATLKPTKKQREVLEQESRFVGKLTHEVVRDNINNVVKTLRSKLKVEPSRSSRWIKQQVERSLREHVVVQTSQGLYDPVLSQAAQCSVRVDRLTKRALKVRAELLVRYVVKGKWSPRPIKLGRMEWYPHKHGLVPLQVAIVDHQQTKMPDGLPEPAQSGCFKGMFAVGKRTSTTLAFPGIASAESGCSKNAIPPQEGRVLAQVILRSTIRVRRRWVGSIDRILLDRFGYVKNRHYGLRSGPMFSDSSIRRLLPMKVELWVGGGLPVHAVVLDRLLASLWKRRAYWHNTLAKSLGGKRVSVSRAFPPPLVWGTLGVVARLLPGVIPKGMWSMQPYPWRLATVMRRGFQARGKHIVIANQTLFDIMDWPMWVVPPLDVSTPTPVLAEARLKANVRVGVLVTEAERVAATMYMGTTRIVNASAMYRASTPGSWLAFPPSSRMARQLPTAVLEAGRQRIRNREMLWMTPGPIPFLGQRLIAWWRVHRDSGMALGEIRYDGTFYGGIAVAKAVSSFNECLATQAVLALRGARLHPQIKCCMVHAAKTWLEENVDELVGGAVNNAAVKFMAGVRIGKRLFRAAYKLRDLKQQGEGLEQIRRILNGDQSAAPPCVRLVRDPKGPGAGVKPLELPDDFQFQGNNNIGK